MPASACVCLPQLQMCSPDWSNTATPSTSSAHVNERAALVLAFGPEEEDVGDDDDKEDDDDNDDAHYVLGLHFFKGAHG